ncbi:formyl transferase [Thalassotalea sp. PS06]|uniref:formyl transferase n=1 Tax=Thalassotalea sp. PS06 TaxID=2594005 RepID=UPI001161D44B|nr:formyl transferase [Thalassotalea sp. PS06]QDP01700.1 formyl transferase [Thalassotalea sp. PS06]
MNITILANRDLPANFALNLLLPQLQQHNVTVFLSQQVGKADDHQGLISELSHFESSIVLPLIDEKALDSQLSRHTGFKGFVHLEQHTSGPITFLNHINSPAGLETLANSHPDLIISIRFGRILQSEAIQIPKYGVINLHSGLLPQYRGVMATFWAMLNEEKTIGTTLHTIDDAGIDTGRIISTATLDIDPEKSYLWHVLHLYQSAPEQILNYINALIEKSPLPKMVQSGEGNYFGFPDASALKDFDDRGLKIYDHHELAEFLSRYYQVTIADKEAN